MKKVIIAATSYVEYVLFVWIALFGCSDLYIEGIGMYLSKGRFLLVYFLLCLLLKLLTFQNEELRNPGVGKFFIKIIAVEMYFILIFVQNHFLLVLFLAALILITYALLFIMAVSDDFYKTSSETERIKQKERLQVFICGMTCAVFLVLSCFSIYEEYIDKILKAEEWSSLVEVVEDENSDILCESVLEKYKEIILEINNWSNMSDNEKTELIFKIGIIEMENLGIEKNSGIIIVADELDDYTMGYYSDQEKIIVINAEHISSDSAESNIKTVFHEVFHAYQHQLVDLIDFDSEIVKNSYYFIDAREWKDNIENYISAETDFDAYQAQPLEADARTYSETRAQEYFEAIS